MFVSRFVDFSPKPGGVGGDKAIESAKIAIDDRCSTVAWVDNFNFSMFGECSGKVVCCAVMPIAKSSCGDDNSWFVRSCGHEE